MVSQEVNIVTLYDVPNIWHVPLLLRVSTFQLNSFLLKSNELVPMLDFFSYHSFGVNFSSIGSKSS
jgi:hypothetical protein